MNSFHWSKGISKETIEKMNKLFIFTKDFNDKTSYSEILNTLETHEIDITNNKLKKYLGHNYCKYTFISETKTRESFSGYCGLKLK